MAKNNVEKEVICSAYGKKGFFKVKAAWDIQRVLFSFVDTGSRKSIDCYLPVARAKALVKKFNSGQLDKMLAKSIHTAEAENKQYPPCVWMSPYGGTENNGKCISRYFTLSPGMKTTTGKYNYAVLTAYEFPASKNSLGGFEPKKGAAPSLTIRVPVIERAEFEDKIIELEEAIQRYYDWRYSYENVKSAYNRSNESDRSESGESPTEPAPTKEPESKKELDRQSDARQPLPATSASKETPSSKQSRQNPDEKYLQMTVDSQTNVIYDGIGAYRLRVLDQEGDSHNVVVTAETAKELGENFKQMKTACDSSFKNHSHTHFSMYYENGIYQNVKVLFLTGFPFA